MSLYRCAIAATLSALLTIPACVSAHTRAAFDEIARAAAAPRPLASAEASSDEVALAQEARPELILRLALARAPRVLEAQARVEAALARAAAAGKLEDFTALLVIDHAPVVKPWSLAETDKYGLGLGRRLPAPGTLDAAARAAHEEVKRQIALRRRAELEVVADVRKAYAEYGAADREYLLHLEHMELGHRALELARAAYTAGRASQRDVLRAALEVSRLHADIAEVDGQRKASRARLNTLMARAPDAPLGPPRAPLPAVPQPSARDLEGALEEKQPAVAAAAREVERAVAVAQGATVLGVWPDFTVALTAMAAPGEEHVLGYGLTVGMNLPWFSERRDDERVAAERELLAQRRALQAARAEAIYALRAAVTRWEAARETLAVVERDLLPKARQSYEAESAAFAAGQSSAADLLDALRAYLDARVQRERAFSRVQSALAEVNLAAGIGEEGMP